MVNFKITQVTDLPQSSEQGTLYFTSTGELYLGKTSGFLQVGKSESDIKLVTTLPTTDVEQGKLYVLLENGELSIHIYDGTQFIDLSPSAHTHEISDINSLQSILDTKLDSALLTVVSNRLDNHELSLINSEAGLHGIRLWDKKIQEWDIENNTWIDSVSSVDLSAIEDELNALIQSKLEGLETAPLDHTHEISDIKELQDTLDGYFIGTSDNILHLVSELEGKASKDDIISLQLSANQINETSDKVFVTANDRAMIQSASTDVSVIGQRLADLENEIDNMEGTTDELVKLDENDVAGYLGTKIDDSTLQVDSGKIVAKGLSGLTSTITELNLLQGASANIQAQIDSLNAVGNFTTSVDTKADLNALTDMTINDMVIVISDESLTDSPTAIYIYSNNNTWMFAGYFKGGELRDFTLNPININTETTGMLPKARYELQSALDTSFIDINGNIKSTNVQDGLKEVFQLSDNVRKQFSNVIGLPLTQNDKLSEQLVKYQTLFNNIANAMTSKGVPTYSYNKLNDLPAKIIAIPNVSVDVGVDKVNLFNISATHTEHITLNEGLQLEDITTSVIEYVGKEENVLHYESNFSKEDRLNFQSNNDVLFENGLMLNSNVTERMIRDTSWSGTGNLYYKEVRRSDFESINGLDVTSDSSYRLAVLHNGQLKVANSESSAIPPLSSNIGANGIASASSEHTSGYPAWLAMNGTMVDSKDAWATVDYQPSNWIQYEFNDSKAINKYSVSAYNYPDRSYDIKSWQFQALKEDTNEWVVLDAQVNQSFKTPTEVREFELTNTERYKKYRIFVTAIRNASRCAISEIQMFESNDWTDIDDVSQGMSGTGIIRKELLDLLDGDFKILILTDGYAPELTIKGIYDGFSNSTTTAYSISDVLLYGVDKLDSVNINGTGLGRVGISVDGGISWSTFNGGQWITITDISQGMSFSEINILSSEQLNLLNLENKTIRFAYYLTSDTEISRIELRASMTGTPVFANSASYDVSYNPATKTIIYTFNKSGSYVINYVNT